MQTLMKTNRQKLVAEISSLANKVCKARKLSIATVSRLASDDARFIPNIQDGGEFTIGRHERVVSELKRLYDEAKK